MTFPLIDLDFRRLLKENYYAMWQLEKKCFTLPWSLEQCHNALTQPAFAAFGLWHSRQLVCYISLYHSIDEIEIINLAVLPSLRRRGLGKNALILALQVAQKMGMQKASLEVRTSNHAAINLYTNLGFTQAGIRKKYYPDNGEDALILIKELTNFPITK